MLKDISLVLIETGWPVEMDFYIKKNISLNVKVKSSAAPETPKKGRQPSILEYGDQ